jgi:non-specific serine/threonine protein kinase
MRVFGTVRTVLALGCVSATIGAAAACTGDPDAPDRPAPPRATAEGLAWQRLAPAPSERTEVAAASMAGRIHVIGGYTGDGATVTTVEILDTATGRWQRGPDLPIAVNHAMATTAGGRVHVFGGNLPSGDRSTAAFRLDGDGWHVLTPMPRGRGAGTAVALGDRIYVAGGVGPDGLAREMLVYDVPADRWSTAPGPPTAREHLGGAGFQGRLYTVGGRTTAAGILAAFEAYDPIAGRWERLPDLPTARGGLAAAAACGRIVAVGGEARATFEEAEAYDLETGSWTALPALPTPRHGLGVVTVGSTVYTLSGGPEPGLHVADSTEAIDLGPLGGC